MTVPLLGFSTAGVETSIEVPTLGLVLDLGRCSRTAVNHPIVLISHGHLDHVGAIVQHAARRAMMNMGESLYVVPAAIAPDVGRLFGAAETLDGGAIPRRVIPLAAGEELPIGKHRFVRPFPTFHRVPSQGYTVWERRTRLRDELRDSTGPRWERCGVRSAVDETHEVARCCRSPVTRASRCSNGRPSCSGRRVSSSRRSFFNERVPVADAREMGHIHLDELIARAALLPRTDVVFTTSRRATARKRLARLCAERLPEELAARVRLLGQVQRGAPAARRSAPGALAHRRRASS